MRVRKPTRKGLPSGCSITWQARLAGVGLPWGACARALQRRRRTVWRWLTELNIPDIDLLRALYAARAHYEADLPYGRSAPVYLSRGAKQGDILSPLLFNIVLNALLIDMRQSGVGCRTDFGLHWQSAGRGFADDLAVTTATPAGLQKILDVIARFCQWSGMQVKLAKSVITAFDYSRRSDMPTNDIRYNGESRLPPCTRELPVPRGQGSTIGGTPEHGRRGQACDELHEGTDPATGWAPDASSPHGAVNALSGDRPVSLECRTDPVD